jgi:glycosyltransferase involved in cell wall biosynthesis/GT2 family glycosyltransferase
VRVAVVVPLYRQAQFLVEAVTSALAQSLERTGIVIVNDGCPDPSSHELGTAFAAAYPDRIAYIHQPNAGLSAARNRGIRYALGRWPQVEAFFFLDSDNFLGPHALAEMDARLAADRHRRIGWVYPAPERFGADAVTWYGETPANLYRMLFENQADAGSLVRRDVFDAGIYFDETMRQGYEDWEFFVRVLRQGFAGESCGKCGMYYRVKSQSMLTESQTKHAQILASIHDRHRDILEPDRLTMIEHDRCPRFLWADPDDETFRVFTDPGAVTSVRHSEHGYWPPVLIIGSEEVRQLLADRGVLRGTLMVAQAMAPQCPVSFSIQLDGAKWGLGRVGRRRRLPHLLAFFSWHFQGGAANPSFASTTSEATALLHGDWHAAIQVPLGASQTLPSHLTIDGIRQVLLCARAAGVLDAPQKIPGEHRQGPTRWFAWDRHCVKLETTFPQAGDGRLRIGFAVPWLKLGGVDLCVTELARAFRRLLPDAALYLISTVDGLDCGDARSQAFNEMVFLGGLDEAKRARLCDVVFQSMDLVINAHSKSAYDSLDWRQLRPKKDRPGIHLSYLHVIDEAEGRLVGYPLIAAQLAHLLDGFAVISESLRSFLINVGIDPSRIRIVRNASVVHPASLQAASGLAADKAARLAAGERPLRLLFAGRADYQKGMSRLKIMTDLLAERGTPFELTVVGASVYRGEEVNWASPNVIPHPPTYDEAKLASYYAEADVLVLLSRWEGVPLSLLDAMAHGCVVVATDVGGVSELVEDGVSGFLIPNGRDAEVAAQAADIFEEILRDETGSLAMRREAVATAWRYSWDETAKVFLSFLPDAVKARHGLSER